MTVRVMSATKTVAGSVHPYDYGYEYSLRKREDYTFEYSEAWGWRIVICTPNTGCPVLGVHITLVGGYSFLCELCRKLCELCHHALLSFFWCII